VSRTIFRIVVLLRDTLLINPCHVPEYLSLLNDLTCQLCDSSSSFLIVLWTVLCMYASLVSHKHADRRIRNINSILAGTDPASLPHRERASILLFCFDVTVVVGVT
jgi:hypothetical protein